MTHQVILALVIDLEGPEFAEIQIASGLKAVAKPLILVEPVEHLVVGVQVADRPQVRDIPQTLRRPAIFCPQPYAPWVVGGGDGVLDAEANDDRAAIDLPPVSRSEPHNLSDRWVVGFVPGHLVSITQGKLPGSIAVIEVQAAGGVRGVRERVAHPQLCDAGYREL